MNGCVGGEKVDRCKCLLLGVCLSALVFAAGCRDITIEEFPICTDKAAQGSPAISKNIVVWRDGRDTGCESIYGYNLDTGTEFLIHHLEETQYIHATIAFPDIDGNIVVWQQLYDLKDPRGYDIWGYNLETGEKFPICTDNGSQTHAKISGHYVAWLNYVRPSAYEVCAYDILTSKKVFSSSAGDFTRFSFDLWHNLLMIESTVRDLETGNEITIPMGRTWAGYLSYYNIDNNTVIWTDYSPTSHLWAVCRAGDIVAYDITEQKLFRLPETWTKISTSAISNNLIVWDDHSNIRGYDLDERKGFTVCNKAGQQSNPDIDGDIIVWTDKRNYGNSNSDIYGARILNKAD
jgi:beta propeller repeat protein